MGVIRNDIKTVPNQRIISINKSPTDKQHLYTTNNLAALDEAATKLKSIGGFKLYIYLAKNQNNYSFALSSKAFQEWSGLGKQAYTTAFDDLVKQGYLVQDISQKNVYYFYDKCKDKEEIEQIQRVKEQLYKEYIKKQILKQQIKEEQQKQYIKELEAFGV